MGFFSKAIKGSNIGSKLTTALKASKPSATPSASAPFTKSTIPNALKASQSSQPNVIPSGGGGGGFLNKNLYDLLKENVGTGGGGGSPVKFQKREDSIGDVK